MKKSIMIVILSMVMICNLSACGGGESGTASKQEKAETEEIAENDGNVSKQKDTIEKAIKLNRFEELSNNVEGFDAENIQTIHLDDVVLTADEFALTNKDDYTAVMEKVSDGRKVEENIAGDITISFSDFKVEYSRIYKNGSCTGITVTVKPQGEKCNGFYIECADSNWYIADDFLICSEYPDYSDVLEEVYSKITVDESKLSGGGIVGIWYCVGTSDEVGAESIYVFYNDNTGINFANHVVNCNFTYEIQDDENMLINYWPERGGEGKIEKYTLDGDTWSSNSYDDRWFIYTRIK